jgi:hypothetical protein
MSEITQPEANAFKAKSIARGKLLERFRCHVQEVVEHAEDEGDRVYFGTSNHFEYLKEIADEMDMWGWDAVIRERDEVDPYADLRKVRDENRALIEERDRLREENERLRQLLRPFANIGIGTNPDYEPMIRMDREAIVRARAALEGDAS